MSEQRFKIVRCCNNQAFHYEDNGKKLSNEEVVDVLNGQQSTIDQLNLAIDDLLSHTSCDEIKKENEQLRQELQGMGELLQSYRKTIKHDGELLADASKKGYLPPLDDYVSEDGWICGCCKHFHSGVRDRCDKDNNWVLKDGSCQDFERSSRLRIIKR